MRIINIVTIANFCRSLSKLHSNLSTERPTWRRRLCNVARSAPTHDQSHASTRSLRFVNHGIWVKRMTITGLKCQYVRYILPLSTPLELTFRDSLRRVEQMYCRTDSWRYAPDWTLRVLSPYLTQFHGFSEGYKRFPVQEHQNQNE